MNFKAIRYESFSFNRIVEDLSQGAKISIYQVCFGADTTTHILSEISSSLHRDQSTF